MASLCGRSFEEMTSIEEWEPRITAVEVLSKLKKPLGQNVYLWSRKCSIVETLEEAADCRVRHPECFETREKKSNF